MRLELKKIDMESHFEKTVTLAIQYVDSFYKKIQSCPNHNTRQCSNYHMALSSLEDLKEKFLECRTQKDPSKKVFFNEIFDVCIDKVNITMLSLDKCNRDCFHSETFNHAKEQLRELAYSLKKLRLMNE